MSPTSPGEYSNIRVYTRAVPQEEVKYDEMVENGLTRTLLGAKGIATRSKDATRGSWPYY